MSRLDADEERELLEDARSILPKITAIIDKQITRAEEDLLTKRAEDFSGYMIKFERVQGLHRIRSEIIADLKESEDIF